MNIIIKIITTLIIIFGVNNFANAAESLIKLDKAPIEPTDKASLQRGAQTYMNNCLGCHSLKFTRLDSLAKGIGITDEEGNLLKDLVKENFLFVGDSISDPVLSAMPVEDSTNSVGPLCYTEPTTQNTNACWEPIEIK